MSSIPVEELDAAAAAARTLVNQSKTVEEQITFVAPKRDADLMAEAPRLIPLLLGKIDERQARVEALEAEVAELHARVAELEKQLPPSPTKGVRS